MLKMRLSGFESSIALNPSSTKLNIPPNQNSAATCLRKKKKTLQPIPSFLVICHLHSKKLLSYSLYVDLKLLNGYSTGRINPAPGGGGWFDGRCGTYALAIYWFTLHHSVVSWGDLVNCLMCARLLLLVWTRKQVYSELLCLLHLELYPMKTVCVNPRTFKKH